MIELDHLCELVDLEEEQDDPNSTYAGDLQATDCSCSKFESHEVSCKKENPTKERRNSKTLLDAPLVMFSRNTNFMQPKSDQDFKDIKKKRAMSEMFSPIKGTSIFGILKLSSKDNKS